MFSNNRYTYFNYQLLLVVLLVIIVAKQLFNIFDVITDHTSIIKNISLLHDLIRQGKVSSNYRKQNTGWQRNCSLDKLTISHKNKATAL